MKDRLTIALIYGSGRQGRFADTIAGWLEPELAGFGQYDIVRVDPAELAFTPGGLDAASAGIVESAISQADAFLIVTPEYNHAYPAALKAVIDCCFRPWHAKPVAFVSYGGVSGGLRAVEQLRLVFAELHAVAIRETVSLAHAWTQFDPAGNPFRPGQLNGQLAVLMKRLTWWAEALKAARIATRYDEAAA
ncbi:NADPH-dependent FMN reductase [Shinella sp.]|uniref:NADPH-dependent FMN reductase n=1 Tax=Shinella sp. TaxID=1870904 RepID=UPI00301D4575